MGDAPEADREGGFGEVGDRGRRTAGMQVVGHGIHLSAPFWASSCCVELCWTGVVVDDAVVA